MNKSAIKNFSIWARNKLISDIIYQAGLLGVTEKGIAKPLSQSTSDVQFFDIGTKNYISVRGKAIRQRDAFVQAIENKQNDTEYASAFRFIVEKVAYTWFNRLIAIRFMEINDYLPGRVRVLSSENLNKAEPDMVTRPFDTDLTFSDQEREEIERMKEENHLDGLFRMLFIRQCQKLHEVLPVLFDSQEIERSDSYLELLLTISFTDKDGVLWHLVHDISEDDFNVEKEGQVEIIGWMYQYYNTEPKDQVFANLKKNIKISKDTVPAATQLFTPDWIVRYMVENSLGRLWVEGHPNETLRKSWKYYLDEAEQEPQVRERLAEIRTEYAAIRPDEIRVIDPCMGSGHILVYLFDVLMQIYDSQGWTQREAAQSIVKNNLYGLDIDDRAAQLAYFAVMMKARQYDRRFLTRGIAPHVYSIQESNDINRDQLKLFGGDMNILEKNNALNQLNELLDKLRDAKEYGSILEIPDLDWNILEQYLSSMETVGQLSMESINAEETQSKLLNLVEQGRTMAQTYHVAVTNPPYMGSLGMGTKLSLYVKKHYPDSKSDLFAVFIERIRKMLVENGYQAMITQHAWMFLSSFEKLRIKMQTVDIVNMAHLGARAFEEIGGEVVQTTAFVIRNSHLAQYSGTYCRLLEPTTQQGKEEMFLSQENRYVAQQGNFSKIPGAPIVYTLSDKFYATISGITLAEVSDSRCGMNTGDNDEYIRYWFEINILMFEAAAYSIEKFHKCGCRYAVYNKGGIYRKWYGNLMYVIKFDKENYAVLLNQGNHLPSRQFYFRDCITWTDMSTHGVAFRYQPVGSVFDGCAATAFPTEKNNLWYILGFLNSSYVAKLAPLINPTLHFKLNDYAKIPFRLNIDKRSIIDKVVNECVQQSKVDWDAFETSWDFQRHPLLPSKENSHIEDGEKIEPSTDHQITENIDEKQMEFAIFCVENLATELNKDSVEIFDLLTVDSDLLYSFIISNYDSLHTQDKNYICEEVQGVMRERGLLP